MAEWRPWNETKAGTNAGAIATHDSVTGTLHRVTHISGHTDKDAFITIRDGDETGTVLWEIWIDVSVNGNSFAINIPNGVYGTPGTDITGYISDSTTNCQINISGTSLP